MFLADLNEHERKHFLDLAYLAMESSGQIKDEEKEVFASYAFECMMEDYEPEASSVDAVTSALAESTPQAKKIILIELMGIWAVDNSWDDGEIDMMNRVGDNFGIPEAMVNRLRRWTRELRTLIAEGCELIEG